MIRSVLLLAIVVAAHSLVATAVNRFAATDATTVLWKNNMVTLHKNSRLEVYTAPVLAWDQVLANEMGNYLNTCVWGHDAARQTTHPQPVGENIYARSPIVDAPTALTEAHNSWKAEKAYFINSPINAACTAGQVCGHYTQLVWKASTAIGCAYATCATATNLPGWTNIVIVGCRYYPAGNYLNQKAFGETDFDAYAPGTLNKDGKIYYMTKSGELVPQSPASNSWTLIAVGIACVALTATLVAALVIRRRRSAAVPEAQMELLA
jgi:pathogenesis-related protein 1